MTNSLRSNTPSKVKNYSVKNMSSISYIYTKTKNKKKIKTMTQVRWSVVLFVLTKSIKMITFASTAAWSKKLQKFSVDFFVLVSIVLHFTWSSLYLTLSLSLRVLLLQLQVIPLLSASSLSLSTQLPVI